MLGKRFVQSSVVVGVSVAALLATNGCSSSREQKPVDTGPAPATCGAIEADYSVDSRIIGGGCPDPPTTLDASVVAVGHNDDNGHPEYDVIVPALSDAPCPGVFIECVLYAHCVRTDATVDLQWTFDNAGGFRGKDGLNGVGVYQNCAVEDIGSRKK